MNLRSLRRRCEQVLDQVSVPEPFDVDAFSVAVSERRGRPLHLVVKDTSVGPCGIWISLPAADYVFFEAGTSAVHREHIILHELGHLLADHDPTEAVDDDVLRELFPSLDPGMVRRVLGRSGYTATEEQEAEMFASVVLEKVGRRRSPPGSANGRNGEVIDRLNEALDGYPGA